jgi:hypothetical protein
VMAADLEVQPLAAPDGPVAGASQAFRLGVGVTLAFQLGAPSPRSYLFGGACLSTKQPLTALDPLARAIHPQVLSRLSPAAPLAELCRPLAMIVLPDSEVGACYLPMLPS